MYIFKQGLLRCRQITWKIPLLRLIFFDKITDWVLANLPKIRSLACIFYGFRSCYLSKFHDILGKVIPWKTFRLRAADRCNVFKMFIPTKILYIQGRTLESKKTQDVSHFKLESTCTEIANSRFQNNNNSWGVFKTL